jgi:hypothetical protein
MYTREQIEAAMLKKNYKWFTNGDLDVNIVGIRNKKTNDKVTNLFDDLITISFKEGGEWKYFEWAITTDPGTKAMLDVTNPKGVAVLVPRQYRSSHYIGLHKGKYDALCQSKPVSVWRDANKDTMFDPVNAESGVFGINIHKSNSKTESTWVENWSEGCQVFKRAKDFAEFMSICKRASKIHGNSFTYTLLESDDII